jgi:hypothetical protein
MALGNSDGMHPNVRRKETIGAFAAAVWLVSGVFLFATSETASFLTWQGAAYFIVGPTIAAVLFAAIFHLFERWASKSLTALVVGRSRSSVGPVFTVALVLIAVETIAVFLTSCLVMYGLLF